MPPKKSNFSRTAQNYNKMGMRKWNGNKFKGFSHAKATQNSTHMEFFKIPKSKHHFSMGSTTLVVHFLASFSYYKRMTRFTSNSHYFQLNKSVSTNTLHTQQQQQQQLLFFSILIFISQQQSAATKRCRFVALAKNEHKADFLVFKQFSHSRLCPTIEGSA